MWKQTNTCAFWVDSGSDFIVNKGSGLWFGSCCWPTTQGRHLCLHFRRWHSWPHHQQFSRSSPSPWNHVLFDMRLALCTLTKSLSTTVIEKWASGSLGMISTHSILWNLGINILFHSLHWIYTNSTFISIENKHILWPPPLFWYNLYFLVLIFYFLI